VLDFLLSSAMIEVTAILIAILLAFILFWVGKISYMLQKSLNEILKGLNSLDQRLSGIEKGLESQNDSK
jgi:uncharacterized protein YoxC